MELEWWRWVLLGAGVLLLLGVMVLKGIIIPLFFRKKNLVKLSPTPYDSEMDGKKRLVFAVSKLLPDTNTEINKSNLAWIYQILALDVPVMDTEEDIATATRDLQISIRQFVWMMIRIVDFSPAKK